jgi:hypothetical protein
MGVLRIESCVLRYAPVCVTHWLLMFYEKRKGNFPRSFTKQSLKIWRKGSLSIFLIFSLYKHKSDVAYGFIRTRRNGFIR